MKNLLILLMSISLGILAEEASDNYVETMPENEYENGCSNEMDDDMDGFADSEDTDCTVLAALWGDTDADDVKGILVWGVGIALLSSVGSDSGTGTATTD
tara:strand:- start:25614 stop:25913 length:300 start_codon:yes stop_codon:yes gene_type:complete